MVIWVDGAIINPPPASDRAGREQLQLRDVTVIRDELDRQIAAIDNGDWIAPPTKPANTQESCGVKGLAKVA